MRNFLDHAAEARRIRPLDDLIQLLQTQRPHNDFVLFRARDGAADQLDTESYPWLELLHGETAHLGHDVLIAQLLERVDGCLHHVMRIMAEPIDLVSTFGIPAA